MLTTCHQHAIFDEQELPLAKQFICQLIDVNNDPITHHQCGDADKMKANLKSCLNGSRNLSGAQLFVHNQMIDKIRYRINNN